jgi:transposase-like protein
VSVIACPSASRIPAAHRQATSLTQLVGHALSYINRGIGLTGLPDAIGVVWPQAIVQLCVVHYADLLVMPTRPVVPLVAVA